MDSAQQTDGTKNLIVKATPYEVVLQWLSYAFWGWLAAALVWLMAVVLNLVIADNVLSEQIPYVIAANVVLLPIAYVVDMIYRRRELGTKAGMSAVVMVIHAVIFALIAIGTLIGTVFVGVSLLTSVSSDLSMQIITLLSMLFASLLYAGLFSRIISPLKPKRLSRIVSISMLVISLGLLVWGAVGPVTQMVLRKNDRRVEQYLPALQSGIDQYVDQHGQLPENLKMVGNLSPDAQSLVDDNAVTYKVDGEAILSDSSISILRPQNKLHYQLCVSYIAASSEVDSSQYFDSDTSSEYKSYLSTYGHPKGDVCYKLEATTPMSDVPLRKFVQ